jgi:hypothetical protein
LVAHRSLLLQQLLLEQLLLLLGQELLPSTLQLHTSTSHQTIGSKQVCLAHTPTSPSQTQVACTRPLQVLPSTRTSHQALQTPAPHQLGTPLQPCLLLLQLLQLLELLLLKVLLLHLLLLPLLLELLQLQLLMQLLLELLLLLLLLLLLTLQLDLLDLGRG